MRLLAFLLLFSTLLGGIQGLRADDAAPKLAFPLDCTLGETCWTARYNDRLEGEGKADYMCGDRTQHRHRGTDFALRNLDVMRKGMRVLAAADGTVQGVRTTMPDISIRLIDPAIIKDKECGNGVMISHAGGWSTQYCHMKQNSITVKAGDTVTAGDKIGEVGLSGETEYPHMHFAVRKDGERIDPYDGQSLQKACTKDTSDNQPLWQDSIPYEDMALTYVSLTAAPPTTETRWDPQPQTLDTNSPALIVTGRVFGAKEGDRWLMEILKPDGSVFYKTTLTLKRDRQFQLQYAGKKKPAGGFSPGRWSGRVLIIRQREDGTIFKQTRTTNVVVSN